MLRVAVSFGCKIRTLCNGKILSALLSASIASSSNQIVFTETNFLLGCQSIFLTLERHGLAGPRPLIISGRSHWYYGPVVVFI